MQDFKGRTAVVTGGGSGIGRGLAIALAREGANVVVSDVEEAKAKAVASEVGALGVRAIAVRTDVADFAAVQALARAAEAEFGKVHVLCNNAGVSIHRRGIDATHEDWRWVLGVNLWGVVHGMEAFLPGMLAHGEPAHIVNTSSMNGIFPSAHSAMYSTSKYGVLGLTETFARELEGRNVGICALCPAAVATDISNSERNRPADLVASRPPSMPHELSSRWEISPRIDPVTVGEMTVNGIRKGQLHIFTDMKVQPIIQAKHDRMSGEFGILDAFLKK